jgi:hypothetical protein
MDIESYMEGDGMSTGEVKVESIANTAHYPDEVERVVSDYGVEVEFVRVGVVDNSSLEVLLGTDTNLDGNEELKRELQNTDFGQQAERIDFGFQTNHIAFTFKL